jgi:hypothetical protein
VWVGLGWVGSGRVGVEEREVMKLSLPSCIILLDLLSDDQDHRAAEQLTSHFLDRVSEDE